MSKPFFISGDFMILGYSDARRLSTAVLAAADLAQRHGANLNPKILHLAAQIHSATGHSEPVRPTFEDTAEYEQITTASAAEILGCSERNVRRLAQRGRLPGVRNGKPWYFNREDVEAYRDYR
ncbi:hypothetical protein HMPREF2943_10500 [Corynebacterium sp. HMSC072D12]|uniref:helix-turn-helix domain-containing protein n=1 Tax=Corynebacterium sp. HMSC072D12 TaxID=1739447 RepID=UPI0008A46204|nr:helix-turn-helix domain-containing protein [Corynebacterium sp. HMSC072D12]OFQ35886.1 hypothetical protein HMPREF2943_10500 [Corynebacterium sp. HMSC072D12]